MKIDLRRNRISYKEPFVPNSAIEWESFFINLLKQYRLSYKLFDEFKKETIKLTNPSSKCLELVFYEVFYEKN